MNKKINNILLFSSFIVCLTLTIWVIVFKCAIPKEILGSDFILEPLTLGSKIQEFMNLTLEDRFLWDFKYGLFNGEEKPSDVFLNFLILVPLGIYLSIIFKNHKLIKTILFSFLFSATIEIFQLFTAFGCFSFIDLISNIIGAIIGYFIYVLLIKFIKEERQIKVINITNIVVLIIFVPLVIFALVYTTINFKYVIFRFSYLHY